MKGRKEGKVRGAHSAREHLSLSRAAQKKEIPSCRRSIPRRIKKRGGKTRNCAAKSRKNSLPFGLPACLPACLPFYPDLQTRENLPLPHSLTP
jgi:hypothetical protein